MPFKDPDARRRYAAQHYRAHRAETLVRVAARRARFVDDIRANDRRRYAANRDARRAVKAAYRATHRADSAARDHARYVADPAAQRDRDRRWREAHPVRSAALHKARDANRTALLHGCQGRLTGSDIEALWVREPTCRACGIECSGIDHVVGFAEGGPNTPNNIQNLCLRCNVRKSNAQRAGRKVAA